MKESFWTYLIIALGLFVIVVLIIVQDITTTAEEDYYLMKEVMEAAMVEAVDYGVYRAYGEIRIIEEKFVENFTRRFAESVTANKNYKLEFFEIYESPPKASVRISTSTREYTVNSEDVVDFSVVTILSSIMETKYEESKYPNGYGRPNEN